MRISKAMIMAAGFGKRMLPLTQHTPKPLLKVKGKEMLSYIVDYLISEEIKDIVINAHHLSDQIKAFVEKQTKRYPHVQFHFIHEQEILETGGGYLNAQNHIDFGQEPTLIVNADIFWQSPSPVSFIKQLTQRWDPNQMDALLLLAPQSHLQFFESAGDYKMRDDGGLIRRNSLEAQFPYTYMGIQLINPALMRQFQDQKVFSFVKVWDELEKNNRLYGNLIEHENLTWYHIDTPERLSQMK